MATFLSFPVPTTPTAATLFSASLATVTSTADIVVGNRQIIGVTAAGTAGANASLNIRFMNATKNANASASDFFVPAGIIQFFDTGEEFDRVRIFNPSGGSITYYVYVFSRT